MIIRFLSLLVIAVPLAAQAPLTITDAVRAALATHPAVREADALLDAAAAGIAEARAGWLPSVALDAGATRFGDPMVVAPLHGFDPANPPLFDRTLWQSSLNLSWDVFDPGRRGRIGRARAESRAADAGAEGSAQAVTADVALTFMEVVTARELVRAHDARVAALHRERDRAAMFVEQGRAARVVLLRAEAAVASAGAERLGAVGRRDAAERSLERLVGVESGALANRDLAAVALREPNSEITLAASPDLARLEGHRAVAEAARRQARGAWIPQVRVLGRVIQYGSGEGAEAIEWQAGLALSYPLFTGGTRGARGAQASAQVAAADARLADARRLLGDAIDRTLAARQVARGQIAALDLAIAHAEEVVRIERLGLGEGAGVQTDYLSAEAELLRVRAARGEAYARAIGAHIELARLTGVLSPAWIATHVESGQ